MAKSVTKPPVGKVVDIRTRDGRTVKGRIAWSKEGAWRLAGSGRLYYAPQDVITAVAGEVKPSLWARLKSLLKRA